MYVCVAGPVSLVSGWGGVRLGCVLQHEAVIDFPAARIRLKGWRPHRGCTGRVHLFRNLHVV